MESLRSPTEDLIKKVISRIGDMDEDISSYIIAINKYKGVTTVSSCAGHIIEEVGSQKAKTPGRSMSPYVDIVFDNPRLLSSFCEEVIRLGDKANVAIYLHPPTSSIAALPASNRGGTDFRGFTSTWRFLNNGDALSTIRQQMFQQVIGILDTITTRENWHELELKAEAIKILAKEE